MIWDQTIWGLFERGGFAMWPLLLCSVLALAIIAERLVYHWRVRYDESVFKKELWRHIQTHSITEAGEFARSYRHPVPRIVAVYLKYLGSDTKRNQALKREGSLELEGVERYLKGLATIAHLSPLLGLLGTVTGLVAAFHRIEVLGGQVQPGDLASGIWEALVTTVFGLVIAIPCMATYHEFENAADKIARRMQFIVSDLDEFFGKKSSGDFKAEDVESREEEMWVVG